MSKHTPGPWELWHDNGGKFPTITIHRHGLLIATTRKNAVVHDETREANARLIAAAPELLEALELIARFIKDGDEVDGEEHEMSIDDAFQTATDAIDIARAAIAKAKGEA